MIVVDTNVVCYLLIRGEHSDSAQRLFDADSDWVGPRLLFEELLNVLVTYERKSLLADRQIMVIVEEALELIGDSLYELPPERVLAVARRTGLSGYDSQFVALAEDLDVGLVTWDRQIIERCPTVARTPA
jgi:predicted nucleic acid-binding protein